MTTVTVVIPAFNAERYIGEALASIREQTLRDVEVLIVDDGSTDGTLREVEHYAASLDLTIVRQVNGGPSAARNAGIRRARGRYCAFLDADDVMLPDLLATQAALLDTDPELGMVITDVSTFDEHGIIHAARWNLSGQPAGMVLERLLTENFVTTSAVMARRECLLKAGLFNEERRVAEDYELWLRMAATWRVGLIDRSLVRYRYHGNSLSSNRLYSSQCALEVIQSFWREHTDYLKNHQRVYRLSMARHLANAGAAALAERSRGTAIAYLISSLRYDPGGLAAWKCLAKALVLP